MVNTPYVGSEVSRVQRYHTEQIPASDAINFVLLALDLEYRQRVANMLCHQLTFNKKLKPALMEISQKYGYKIPDILDLFWEQSNIF